MNWRTPAAIAASTMPTCCLESLPATVLITRFCPASTDSNELGEKIDFLCSMMPGGVWWQAQRLGKAREYRHLYYHMSRFAYGRHERVCDAET